MQRPEGSWVAIPTPFTEDDEVQARQEMEERLRALESYQSA